MQWSLEAPGAAAGTEGECVCLNPSAHSRPHTHGEQRPSLLPGRAGILQGRSRRPPGPPCCHVLALWNKSDSVLEKMRGYEKDFPLQGFTFGGKMLGLAGPTRAACTKAPLSPHPHPSARQWHRKKLSFQRKIKQASEPRLAGFHAARGLGAGGSTPSQLGSWWVTWRPREAAQLGAEDGAHQQPCQ